VDQVNIAITGASGLIGRRLLEILGAAGHALMVVSRHAGTNVPPGVGVVAWDPMRGPAPEDGVRNANAVIHLAGEPVAQRWNEGTKRRIRESRVVGTRNLVQALAKLRNTPQTLVCASAVGYYGSRGDEELREDSAPGDGYLAEVCEAWEKEAMAAEGFGMRVVRVRVGVVLDAHGGALRRMLIPFRLGVGGKLGDGQQWMSWIHLADLAAMFQFAVENPVRGALNGVAPIPVSNADFTQTLARVIHRPAIFPVPAFGLKLLFGEMSEILLASQRVLPAAAEAAGFKWRFPELGGALEDLLGK
jgi:uncharacterized protein (TIGR01777 family)